MYANVLVGVGLLLLLNFEACYGQLQVGFYNGQCGNQDVESIVSSVVTERFTSTSNRSIADVDLPGPGISVSGAIDLFVSKGLTGADMVVLLGGHTVGTSHCNFFRHRLWNFENTGSADPSMEPSLVEALKSQCPEFTNDESVVVDLDQNPASSNIVDNSFYEQISTSRGILEIDQKLALDPSTTNAVSILANDGDRFLNLFGTSMVKMGAVGVLTGTAGEIRLKCGSVN